MFEVTGIVKRLLDAMKGEAVSEDVVTHFMLAFEVLVKSNLSPEVMRSLSLFVTYALHTPPTIKQRPSKPLVSLSQPDMPGARVKVAAEPARFSTSPTGTKFLTKRQLGTQVLTMYSRILCEKGNMNHINKFARTVTNKASRAMLALLLPSLPTLLTTYSGSCIYYRRMIPKSSFKAAEYSLGCLSRMALATRPSSLVNLAASSSWRTN